MPQTFIYSFQYCGENTKLYLSKLGYMVSLAAQAKIDALFECLHSQTLTVYDERSLSYTAVE